MIYSKLEQRPSIEMALTSSAQNYYGELHICAFRWITSFLSLFVCRSLLVMQEYSQLEGSLFSSLCVYLIAFSSCRSTASPWMHGSTTSMNSDQCKTWRWQVNSHKISSLPRLAFPETCQLLCFVVLHSYSLFTSAHTLLMFQIGYVSHSRALSILVMCRSWMLWTCLFVLCKLWFFPSCSSDVTPRWSWIFPLHLTLVYPSCLFSVAQYQFSKCTVHNI